MQEVVMFHRATFRAALVAGTALVPAAALADVPRVAADIAPIHSLVAMVMGDLGAPELVLPASADPHSHALRPSEAASLQEADIVVWVGSDLTPWMAEPIETLAGDAVHLSLLDVPGIELRGFREDANFAPHDHGDHDHDHDHDPRSRSS
jgi:zinc transport system substrate-binding protein